MSAEARPDARAQAAALGEWRRPVWIEAGAGTGKTTLLVARVAAWALGPGWERNAPVGAQAEEPERTAARVLSRLVAITFTEAAAADMAVRVGSALRDVGAGRPVPVLDDAELPEPADRAVRARALLASLEQLPVQTIHAFCRRTLAAHAVEAGLHPRFQVDADERASFAVAREVTEGALQEAYARGDADVMALAAMGIGPPELEEALRFLIQAGVPAAELERDPLAPATAAPLIHELREALDALRAGEAGVLSDNPKRSGVQRTAQRLARTRAELENADPAAIAELARRVAEVWDHDTDWKRLCEWARDGFHKEGDELGASRGAVVEACAAVVPRLRLLRQLDPERMRRTRRVLAPWVVEAERELRRRGFVTYGGLLRETRDLLARSPAVRSELRLGMDQLLVDEFQDTDGVQCEIVRRLALEGPEAQRPGLFVVGDPKQSIYGWRNADLRAYRAFTDALASQDGVAAELVVNRRSVPSVLAEVERAIAPVMRAEAGVQPAFQRLVCGRAGASQASLPDGAVEVEHWVSWPWSDEQGPQTKARVLEANRLEAWAVAQDLLRLHASGVEWNRFALLFRSTGQLDVYLAELRDTGIPYVVERDRTFYERREILDAMGIVRTVLDPHDQVALVAALRSAAVGVPDAALLPLWRASLPARVARLGERDDASLEAADAAVRAAVSQLPDDVPELGALEGFEASLRDFLRRVHALRRDFRRLPPDRFVERLRTHLLLEPLEAARSLGPWRLANLDRFFRDLAASLEEGGGDVAGVLGALRGAVSERREEEEGRPREAADRAVHVGTIHKAKGLAFDHVYLCQVHKGHGGGGGGPDHAVVHRGEQSVLRLFGQPDLAFPSVAAERQAVERAEQVRTLYVALTRARDRLVVSGMRSGNGDHARLLRESSPAEGALETWMREAAAAGRWYHEADGVRWVFPALRDGDAVAAPTADLARRVQERRDILDRDVVRLSERLQRSRERSVRPFHVAASDGHGALAEVRAARDEDETGRDGAPLSREEAMQAGTAVHAALEIADFAADPAALAETLRDTVAAALPEAADAAARARAEAVLERFVGGPLVARLRALAPHVLARELPVLLPPAGEGPDDPVGFVAGAIDLLYRDPEGGGLVVADYKTDGVEGDALRARAESYAGQGRVYVRAVQEALALPAPPRFELWFLHAGEVVRVG